MPTKPATLALASLSLSLARVDGDDDDDTRIPHSAGRDDGHDEFSTSALVAAQQLQRRRRRRKTSTSTSTSSSTSTTGSPALFVGLNHWTIERVDRGCVGGGTDDNDKSRWGEDDDHRDGGASCREWDDINDPGSMDDDGDGFHDDANDRNRPGWRTASPSASSSWPGQCLAEWTFSVA